MHGLPSSHELPPPLPHTPAWHVSPTVQASLSSHAAPLLVAPWTQPLAGLHASVVQVLESSQLTPTPLHAPLKQPSLVVHALPSLHALASATMVWLQPPALVHASVVQSLPSLQLVVAPPPQVPVAQVSPVVHLSPSSQALPSLPFV